MHSLTVPVVASIYQRVNGRFTMPDNLIEEIEGYPSSTIFALDPSVDLDELREGPQTGWLNRDRIAWLGLEGKSLYEIQSTDNPYKQHPDIPKPWPHLAYDLELGRIIVRS